MMGKKDIISKEAIKRIAVDLATILLELDIDPETLELLETEKQRIEDRRADLVARVQDTKTGKPYLLHIEIQNDNNSKMPLRMLRYYTDIRLSGFREPLHQYLGSVRNTCKKLSHPVLKPHTDKLIPRRRGHAAASAACFCLPAWLMLELGRNESQGSCRGCLDRSRGGTLTGSHAR